MYARKVSLSVKSDASSQFFQKVEQELIPLFRKQKGFLDYLIVLSDKGREAYVFSFWENNDDAEKHDRAIFPVLPKLLTGVFDGSVRIHAFGGFAGRFSGEMQAEN